MTTDTPRTYHITRDLGEMEGPYDVDQLRELLKHGALRADDRIFDDVDRRPIALREVIPDADTQAVERPRVARQRSDRLRAVGHATDQDAEAKRHQDSEELKEAIGALQQRRRLGARTRVIVGAVAASVILATLVVFQVDFQPSLDRAVLNGSWKTQGAQEASALELPPGARALPADLATRTAPKELHLEIQGSQLRWTCGGDAGTTTWEVLDDGPTWLAVSWGAPLPVVGGQSVISQEQGELLLISGSVRLKLLAKTP